MRTVQSIIWVLINMRVSIRSGGGLVRPKSASPPEPRRPKLVDKDDDCGRSVTAGCHSSPVDKLLQDCVQASYLGFGISQ
ncbi:unnamed protein product [Linum trigynum]|uniref:Uncharacterized protein n=1 Tax=Linum trigynum TaxID=586398 RepID=A0AAV2EUF5_9ROSI